MATAWVASIANLHRLLCSIMHQSRVCVALSFNMPPLTRFSFTRYMDPYSVCRLAIVMQDCCHCLHNGMAVLCINIHICVKLNLMIILVQKLESSQPGHKRDLGYLIEAIACLCRIRLKCRTVTTYTPRQCWLHAPRCVHNCCDFLASQCSIHRVCNLHDSVGKITLLSVLCFL